MFLWWYTQLSFPRLPFLTLHFKIRFHPSVFFGSYTCWVCCVFCCGNPGSSIPSDLPQQKPRRLGCVNGTPITSYTGGPETGLQRQNHGLNLGPSPDDIETSRHQRPAEIDYHPAANFMAQFLFRTLITPGESVMDALSVHIFLSILLNNESPLEQA